MKLNFTEIVDKYSEPLYWYIRRMVVDHYDAEDILQDVLVKAYRKLWQLRDPDAIKPWLYRIAVNQTNTFLRRRYRTDSLSDELAEKLSSSEYVDYTMEAEIKLQQALLRLSPLEKEVFTLKYYDDMDYEQIAVVTGSKPETLKVSYHNAKEKVKKEIGL